jgi:tetratricopeptide (TPR) repeat protein
MASMTGLADGAMDSVAAAEPADGPAAAAPALAAAPAGIVPAGPSDLPNGSTNADAKANETAPPVAANAAAPPAEAPAPSTGERAAAPAEKPTAKPPENDFARLLREGRAAATRGKTGRAQSLLEQAIKLRPDSDEALIALANVLLEKPDPQGASAYVERAIRANPGNPDAYLVRGSIEQQLSRNAEARSAYEHYLKLAPHGRYASDIRHILQSL